MTPEAYEAGLVQVAQIQRDAGWPQCAIDAYAKDHRAMTTACGGPETIMLVGAGLAQDNSRYFPEPHPDDVMLYPDGEYCYREDMDDERWFEGGFRILYTDTPEWIAHVDNKDN